MLFLIGLGLEQSPSTLAMQEMKSCNRVFYETYTSPIINEPATVELSVLLGDRFEKVSREFVEDGRKIIELAKSGKVALVCSGDPLVATTHQELRTRTLEAGIETRVIHGSSILCAISGEFGLHSYSFGRCVTLTDEPMQHTAYNTIFQNMLLGLHTAILLQWDQSRDFFLSPSQATKLLCDAENDLKYNLIRPETRILVGSRLGTSKPSLKATTVESLSTEDFGSPPHVLVIPGKLHFTEREALAVITHRSPDWLTDNSDGIPKLSRKMVEKYSQKTLAALSRARRAVELLPTGEEGTTIRKSRARFADVFENVECYTRDAVRFLNEGREELAVLSIGYAEGLLDSLRFAGLLEFEW
ncbi:MAG TPA: diphthine synthase [Nitrososphaerales archaeon]|nr:diphthine synthase [Nitrososphaerales archaeon]